MSLHISLLKLFQVTFNSTKDKGLHSLDVARESDKTSHVTGKTGLILI